jgi:hypothetical protein
MARIGRPLHEPTDATKKQVEKWSGEGVSQDHIAIMLGISAPTLVKHYRFELDCGRAKAHCKMAGKAFSQAMSGDTTLIIWWTKTQMRWKEDRGIELSGPNGAPIAIASHAEPELLGAYLARQEAIRSQRRAHSRPHPAVGADRQGDEGSDSGPDAGEE